MADEFRPKLGKPRSTNSKKSQSYLNRIIKDMRRTIEPGRKRSNYSGSRIGRGYASGALLSSKQHAQFRRRVIVKARITSFKRGGLSAAKAHLKYLQRDGTTLDGERGELYGPNHDQVDGKSFLERSGEDPHLFRIIVAPEDGGEFHDLKPFIRDLMQQAEADLGTKLDWIAVDHFNTGHPHSHIVISGQDDQGKDLIIARDYISRGLRERARDLVTLELGPEPIESLQKKRALEVQAERFTSLDRSLLRDAENGILVLRPDRGSQDQNTPNTNHERGRKHRHNHDRGHDGGHGNATGRLQKLEKMGLVKELKPGIWQIEERTETVLRQLGQRNDIMKIMQRALKQAGLDRGIQDFSLFDPAKQNAKITGQIIDIGLSDELNNRHYLLVDGTDGKIHYAEIGQLNSLDLPRRGLLVTLEGKSTTHEVAQNRLDRVRVHVESHAPLKSLVNAQGATWLDRQLLSGRKQNFSKNGFGLEVNKALRKRQQWLIEQGFMTEKNRRLIARPQMLAELTRRDVRNTAQRLEQKLGLKFWEGAESSLPSPSQIKSLRLASGRFALVQRAQEFSLVPWREVRARRKAIGIAF